MVKREEPYFPLLSLNTGGGWRLEDDLVLIETIPMVMLKKVYIYAPLFEGHAATFHDSHCVQIVPIYESEISFLVFAKMGVVNNEPFCPFFSLNFSHLLAWKNSSRVSCKYET